ncbi:alpha-amylase family glycosyl hydrolase [Christiangramia sabulilitoris]|uniref:1,4-alpha-glucan branching enzyme n=1 Tax=Christiangramia sabulilitoris TaxID=2583991 RepID=A0A550HXA1_9FLAO|nr:alpha-amylase family glycosyl hydrolase [Christiangramia sabulilitoris]TRO63330.1 1,4-alpha-glucan branching protein [Christiangramia sabulilitoris]
MKEEMNVLQPIVASEGMGAIVEIGYTTFRVWAPHAEMVFVSGDFNSWTEDDLELEKEENGYWAGTTDLAKEGDQYKYVIWNSGQKLLRNDPYALEVTNSNGNSIVRTLNFDWEGDDYQLPSWNTLVIYELHVGTFNRKQPDQVGTFDDVIEKLAYLKELGINCIELLPVAEFAGGISWGYNPAHPFAIEQDYGGPDGLFRLVKEAHKMGIGIIMDVVYNHLGPSDVDLWQFDGWSENDKGGIYFYNDQRSETPWGDTRPDYGRPEVRQYFRDNALMWIEKYHCDGLRMDATSYIRYEGGGLGFDTEILEGIILMRDINSEIKSKFPNVLTIAEDLKGQDIITNDIAHGGIGYGTQWDMNFVHPIREALIHPDDDGRNLEVIAEALTYRYGNDVFSRVIYTESHDEVANGKARVPEEIQPGDAESAFAKKRAILGLVLVLTAPGIPMIFQGQEFMEDEYFKDDEGLDWEKYEKLKGIGRLASDLIGLRTGLHGGTNGLRGQETEILHLNQETKILAYKRLNSGDHVEPVLVVINFSHRDYENYGIGIEEGTDWKLRFNSTWKGYDEDFSEMEVDGMNTAEKVTDDKAWTGELNIPAYGAQIYTL